MYKKTSFSGFYMIKIINKKYLSYQYFLRLPTILPEIGLLVASLSNDYYMLHAKSKLKVKDIQFFLSSILNLNFTHKKFT